MFLSPSELQQLTGYQPNQRMRICRWLDQQGIRYTLNRLGDPVVLKKALDNPAAGAEPNFDWLKTG